MSEVDQQPTSVATDQKIPYLMHRDALALKAIASKVLREPIDPQTPEHERDLVVPAQALLSLIEQAHAPQLGLATTQQLRDELHARGPHSPPDYRTFDPEREV